MASKPHWIQILLETIGLSELIGVVIGVPAMIAFVSIIWHSLSLNQQIITAILVFLILVAIALFIRGQVRKVLYVIPSLLYKMYSRHTELARGLNIEAQESINIASLANVDMPSNIKTLFDKSSPEYERLKGLDMKSLMTDNTVNELIRWVSDVFIEQVRSDVESSENIVERIPRYIGRVTGLEKIVATDKDYQKYYQRLEKLRPIIPTKEIGLAVNKYIRAYKTIANLSPSLKAIDDESVSQIIPLGLFLDMLGMPEKIEDTMTLLLAEVRESIEKYYKRN